ncbi:DUF6575 domain-containing protein [Glaciihabitans sp. UYNi722]|uniref:DUF6575 domain-containing protein n=1 Tax=Glaciihabitans sp. UYNi722 TaxID=3156344 RepID=UPI0033973406
MNWLPMDTILGELEMGEVFVDYDGPRLFSLRSKTDQDYLAEWAAGLEDSDLWLYVPVSKLRLSVIRSGGLPVREAFAHPEGFEYLVKLHFDLSIADEVSVISRSQLNDAWLPADDFHLSLKEATHPPAVSLEELARKSYQEGRARFRIEIDDPNTFASEARTRKVAALLNAVQNVFDNFGLVELDTEPHQDGRFTKQVQARMDTDVVELTAASFVIELGAAEREDLFGDSPIAKVSERLVNLLAVDIEPQALLNELLDLKPRAAKSFRAFVNELDGLASSVTVASASSARNVKSQSLTYEQINNLKSLLKELLPPEAREIRGRMVLFAGDFENREFGLRDLFDQESYDGRVGERAVSQVEHATLMNVYDVVLSEYSTVEKAINETKKRYVLDQLSPATDATPVPATFSVLSTASDMSAPWQ